MMQKEAEHEADDYRQIASVYSTAMQARAGRYSPPVGPDGWPDHQHSQSHSRHSQSHSHKSRPEHYQNPRSDEERGVARREVDGKPLVSASSQAASLRNPVRDQYPTTQRGSSVNPKPKSGSGEHGHSTVKPQMKYSDVLSRTSSTSTAHHTHRHQSPNQQNRSETHGLARPPYDTRNASPTQRSNHASGQHNSRMNGSSDFQGNRNVSTADAAGHRQYDSESRKVGTGKFPLLVESQAPEPQPSNSRANSPTRRRRSESSASAVHRQRDPPSHGAENSRAILLGPQIRDADEAIEDVLRRLDRTTEREFEVYHNQIRERKDLQRSLRHCFNFQQKEYMDAFHDLHAKMQQLAHERDELHQQLNTIGNEYVNLQKQLQRATSCDRPEPVPVVSTSTFTPHTADGISGQDLIQDVERLNDEIYQFSACLAEEFEKSPGERNMGVQLISIRESESLEDLFGRDVARFVLRARAQREHSWILHAVQTCLITSCTTMLKALIPLKTRTMGFEKVYQRIRKSEGQGVSGHWRSLISRHGLDITEHKVYDIIRSDIWTLCETLGWSAKDSIHRESLMSIAVKTFHLHKTIYGEILSGDINIICPEPGTLFNPETMDVGGTRGDTRSFRNKPIGCTTDVGLMKSVINKVFSDGEYAFREEATIILKPKVFIGSYPTDDEPESEWFQVSSGSP